MSILRLSETELEGLRRRQERWKPPVALVKRVEAAREGYAMPRALRVPKPRNAPNKLEEAFKSILDGKQENGEIRMYGFERITLKLAHDCRYTPDFDSVGHNGTEFWEVKGPQQWEDSWIKLKVAAAMFPFYRFHLCKREAGEWVIRDVPSR